jgi:type IV pilus assembly protein PilY1
MSIMRFDQGIKRFIGGLQGGVLIGLFLALPAQGAFNPLSGPTLSGPAVSPNVIMLFDNSSSMVLNKAGSQTRLDIARDVAKDVIAKNRNVRFGLFSFRDTPPASYGHDAPGGQLLVEVGDISANTLAGVSHFNMLNTSLDAINPSASPPFTHTPLAETYYEVTRYMRGLRAFYPQSMAAGSRQQFVSPAQYRCQRNAGLILTDGLPTYDSEFPTDVKVEPDIDNPSIPGSLNLPDWDGVSAGDMSSTDLNDEGSTFYLDDIAQFAFDIDMRNTNRTGVAKDAAGVSWDATDFATQTLRTYTVGFAHNDPNLQRAAVLGGGKYYTAENRQELSFALHGVLQEINAMTGSGGGGVASGPDLTSGSRFYRTEYDPADWSGTVEAYNLKADGSLGSRVWSSDSTISNVSNVRYQTWRESSDIRPEAVISLNNTAYLDMGAAQQAVLDLAAAPNSGQDLLNWIRGESVSGYRSRARLLGDVVNSSLVLTSTQRTLGANSHAGYEAYRADKRQNMQASLVVGANDGFLHVLAANNGAHRLAFLPAATQASAGARAGLDFGQGGHRSGVDGAITVADTVLNTTWTTLAVAGLGAGGKALVGIRLYDQDFKNDALGALWEISPNTQGFVDLGHVYGKPVIARLDGRWVAISGNGYGNAGGQPTLYVIDLADGSLIKSIEAGPGDSFSGNGLSAPQVRVNSDGRALAAYAGDLQGRLWKFDLSGQISDWSVAFAGDPLFRAGIAANPHQSITVQPVLMEHPQGGRLVLFGTGTFLEAADRLDTSVQTFYAVWDKPTGVGNLTYANLQAQAILTESAQGNRNVRTVTANRVNWSSSSGQGWYLPLLHGTARGERVIRNILVRGSRVLFNTSLIRNSADPCTNTGGGWLMSVDSFSGSMSRVATLDSNSDGMVDARDPLSAGVSLSGGLPGDLIVLELPRIKPAVPAAPLARGSCNPATEFCPCDPAVDDCVCESGDPACKNIYCGQEYNLSQTSNTLELVVGSGQCHFNRIMWRQLM